MGTFHLSFLISARLKEQELRDAAERGDIDEVARLIKSGVSVNSVSEGEVYMLYSAVRI